MNRGKGPGPPMTGNGTMITTGKEGPVLFRLSWPVALSMTGLVAFNLADTFFVAGWAACPWRPSPSHSRSFWWWAAWPTAWGPA